MTGRPVVEEPAPSGRLDVRVLVALEEMNGRMAFSGLRRSLGAHPESLSRALRRLEREGLIERSDQGYRSTRHPDLVPGPDAELHAVARIDIPPGVEADALLARLSGRWFGSLRWMGVVDRPRGRLLAWARRDGTGTVLLGVDRGTLRIFTTGDHGLTDSADAEDLAYELLSAVAETLRPVSGRPGVTFLAASAPSDGPTIGVARLRPGTPSAHRNN
ncbi:MAG: helix-turn-helix transcriptional regulator [Thermoplasmata archaeon]